MIGRKGDKMRRNKEINCLFEIFASEHIHILMRLNVEKTKQTSKEIEIIKAPLSVSGYLTDEDDFYYYLGSEPNKYEQAIRKDDVLHIELYQEKTELEEIETPDNDTGYN
jgi:hypothetical protein